jgi:predicted nucleic acid-binding Zn ribbon protein
MDARCPREVSIAARQLRRLVAAPLMPFRVAAGRIWVTLLTKAGAAASANESSDSRAALAEQTHHARNAKLKFLLVIGLVALLFVLLYRRLRPYLKIVGNFLNTIRHFQQINAGQAGTQKPGQQAEKLVHCEACGTWIPIGRALASGSPGTFFCSADCRLGRVKERHSAS